MAKKSKHDPLAVDAYLVTLPKAERESLEALRTIIKRSIPKVEERVSYGTAVMFSLGLDLVGFVSQPKHLSFFTVSPKLAHAMRDEITRTHKVSGATIHFSPVPRGSRRGMATARMVADVNHPDAVNRRFSIPSCLIFDSSVEGGIPSLAAAPLGPATFPRLLANAVSIMSFS